MFDLYFVLLYISVSPCAATPCQNDGTCSVDANGEATCACKGEWSGFYCSGMNKFNFNLFMKHCFLKYAFY